jgi:hypothetical protein
MVVVTEPILLLRALKSSEMACLLALTLAGEPVRVSWLGRVTGLSPHTLTSALNTLQALGLAQDDGQRSGWHVAASLQVELPARAESLPVAGECLDGSPPPAGNSPPEPSNRGAADYPAADYPAADYPAADYPAADYPAAICRSAIRAPLKEGEEDLNNLSAPDFDSPPSVSRDLPPESSPRGITRPPAVVDSGSPGAAPVAPEFQVERILAATASLFGEPVHGPASRYPDPHRLLAAIADVHARRRQLRKPARVVYTLLRDGIPPAERYLADPLAYLPVDFLRAAGLPVGEGAGASLGAGWEAETGWEVEQPFAHSQSEDGQDQGQADDASLYLPVLPATKDSAAPTTAAEAWRLAVEVLRGEMPRPAYEKYLRPARLVRFEPGESGGGAPRFTVQAGDEYSRQWLAQRLARSLVRTLAGICQGQVRVEFVAPQ